MNETENELIIIEQLKDINNTLTQCLKKLYYIDHNTAGTSRERE